MSCKGDEIGRIEQAKWGESRNKDIESLWTQQASFRTYGTLNI